MNDKYYIYCANLEPRHRTECISLHDVMEKFKEVLRVHRHRGNVVIEGDDLKWVVKCPDGTTDTLWIEDANGTVVEAQV